MSDEQFWSGGHFYLFMKCFHITRIKLPNRVEDIVRTNLFWKASALSVFGPVSQNTGFVFVSNADFRPPPRCFFLSLRSLRPVSAPGSCPLRVRCGTRPRADDAGSREMSTSEGKVRFMRDCDVTRARQEHWGL